MAGLMRNMQLAWNESSEYPLKGRSNNHPSQNQVEVPVMCLKYKVAETKTIELAIQLFNY